ncbi:MAG: hypothetical protein M1832_003271 [Thelocarpon impressellum]|nr:MAG: hypothetical protein M1832_003271 [Thelocarpon impressellum]
MTECQESKVERLHASFAGTNFYRAAAKIEMAKEVEHRRAAVKSDMAEEMVDMEHSYVDDMQLQASQRATVRPFAALICTGKDIRGRFIENYRRHVIDHTTPTGDNGVALVDLVEEGGDAMLDAIVFQLDQRMDTGVYEAIYQLEFTKALELRKFQHPLTLSRPRRAHRSDSTGDVEDEGGILDILDARATLKARGHCLPSSLCCAMSSVLYQAHLCWKQLGAAKPGSEFGLAKRVFWKEHLDFVDRIREDRARRTMQELASRKWGLSQDRA